MRLLAFARLAIVAGDWKGDVLHTPGGVALAVALSKVYIQLS